MALLKIQTFLDSNFNDGYCIPARSGGKIPLYKHTKNQYNSDKFKTTGYKECANGCLIALPKEIIVVDIDDKEYSKQIEKQFPDFCMTVACQTKKGMHYYFLRNGTDIKDGARQLGDKIPIDFKTKTNTGTGGLISIPPSPDKVWIRELTSCPIEPMPPSFVEFVKKNMKQCKNKCLIKDECDSLTDIDNEIDEIGKLVDILSIDRAEGYTAWMEVGWCLRNLGKSCLSLWVKFSKKSKKYTNGECERLWSGMEERKDGLQIGSLHMWAKKDNPEEYNKLVSSKIDIELIDCHVNHQSIAKLAYKYLKDKYVCATSDGNLWYYFDGSLWKEDEDSIIMRHEISTTIKNKIEHTRNYLLKIKASIEGNASVSEAPSTSVSQHKKRSGDEYKNLNDLIRSTGNANFKKGVLEEMKEYFYDHDFRNKLDANPNIIAFTNGIWDLKEGKFRKSTPSDYVSMSVNYPFIEEINEDYKEMVVKYWETLHPNPEQRDYVQKMLARQLYGDHGNELFHIHTGHLASASNGKTKFFEILENSLGDYVRKFGVEILTAKQRIEPGRPAPEFNYWKGKRILYCTEPNAQDMLNTGILKDLTGGENIQYRLLYDNEVRSFRPQFKVHLMANDPPQVDGADSGIKRRIRKIDYVSRFVDDEEVDEKQHLYKRDCDAITLFCTDEKLKMEFLRVLLSKFDYKYSFTMPDSIKKLCTAYLEDNNVVQKFIKHHLEKDPDGFFTVTAAKERITKAYNGVYFKSTTLITDLQKEMGVQILEHKKINNRKYNNVILGYKLAENIDSHCDLDGYGL